MHNSSLQELAEEISQAEKQLSELGKPYLRLWQTLKVDPVRWPQQEYADAGQAWVIAIKGSECLCFNMIEEGWGWVAYSSWGELTEFHWEQDEIQYAISKIYSKIHESYD